MVATASIAIRLERERWKDPDDLAQELAASLRSGLSITDVNTDSLDTRYAAKAVANTFTEDQDIEGKLSISDAPTTGPAVSIGHAGVGTTNQTGAIVIASSGSSGCLWMERSSASPADVTAMVRDVGSTSNAYSALSIQYQGIAAALSIAHAGGSGGGPFYAMSTNRPVSIGGSGASAFAHSVTVTGNVTATNFVGNLTGTATQASLATNANAVRTGSGNYVTPSQATMTGIVRRLGSTPTGTVTWSQLTVDQIQYLGW